MGAKSDSRVLMRKVVIMMSMSILVVLMIMTQMRPLTTLSNGRLVPNLILGC